MPATTMTQSSNFGAWFTHERRMWIAGVLGSALVGFAGGNGHTTQNAISHVSAQLGDQKKAAAVAAHVAGCEHQRADIATTVAVKSELGHDVDLSDIPGS